MSQFERAMKELGVEVIHAHSPIKGIEHILCIKNKRVLRNDYTITYNGKLYQIKDSVRAKKVTIEERLDGTMYIMVQGRSLEYKEITTRPVRENEKKQSILTKTTKLSPDHPWEKYDFKYGKKAKDQGSSIP